ncbi:MAG: phytoene/squalene synthase family protein [Acidobacteriaceae bacterium]|nr:phytoene/squalene synthase family protein [Acidobacteriaceae bacterium]MBV9502502.1 phytoene/squalene synthase family protein [Acidobacteriaceae bacterium]
MPPASAPVLNSGSVAASYRFCREVAKRRAKNFYYSFLLLEKPQRDAMCAIYAYMRHCDDLSDEPATNDKSELRESIARWRMKLNRVLDGEMAEDPIWPAFHDTVERYKIPHRYFHEMIDGILSDIEPQQVRTFSDLYRYCYRVASVVGLTVIHIFGFRSTSALLLAEKCGVAFQLTNIVRDIREDALMGRVYVPREDLDRFGVTLDQLRSGSEDKAFRELMKFEATRARSYYDESAPLLELIEPKSRRSLWVLRQIYLRLLSRIEKADYSVLSRRVNVPKRTKIALLGWAFLR